MAPLDLHEQIEQRKQHPVRIHVSDGTAYDIDEQSDVILFVTTLWIGLDPGKGGLPHRTMYIDAQHITRVEMLSKKGIDDDISPRSG